MSLSPERRSSQPKKYEELLEENIILKQKNRDLNAYSDILAHDLRAPLKNINNLALMIKIDPNTKLSPKGEENLQKLQNQAQNLHQLVLVLREISEQNIGGLDLEKLSTEAVLNDVLQQYETEISQSGCEIVASSLPQIYANSQLIWQLFDNLLRNALKHGSQPLKIEIDARINAHFVEFTFANSKKNFNTQDQNSSDFSNFSELPKSTGLGLKICQKIVELHNGSISTQSREARFMVNFNLEIAKHV